MKGFKRHAAPGTVRLSVHGIAEACVADPDAILRQLLVDAIADTHRAVPARRRSRRAVTAPATSAPAEA